MATQLNDAKIVMGRAIPVQNSNKARLAQDKYYAIKTEDLSGEVEQWLMYTRYEIDSFCRIDFDLADSMKLGRIYNITPRDKNTIKYIIKIEVPDEEDKEYTEVVVMIPSGVALKGLRRAEKNPEDVPAQSVISDMLD